MNNKPPLGLMPEWRHKELRLQEIREAIKRYLDANEPIPVNWIAEEYCLREWLENRKKPQPPETGIPTLDRQEEKLYTEKEVLQREEDAFNAGRSGHPRYDHFHFYFTKFSDYKNNNQ